MSASFGKRAKRAIPAPREPFEFTFIRDEVPETHHFQARARADMVSLASTLLAAKASPERAMPEMLRLISRMLDNKDGTPMRWEPVPVPVEDVPGNGARQSQPGAPNYEWATQGTIAEVAPEDESEERPRVFRGPDGELHTFDQVEKFTAFEAGSSRRRWTHLMEVDDDVEVDAQDLMELFEWLVGLAAGRPTRPSS